MRWLARAVGGWLWLLSRVWSLPFRALSWVTGWSMGRLAAELVVLHAPLLAVQEGFEWARDGELDVLGWVLVAMWAWFNRRDRRDYEALERWRESGSDAVPPEVFSTLLDMLVFGTVTTVAVLRVPNGIGEVAWAWYSVCIAAALTPGPPTRSVTSRVREWAANASVRAGWSPA